MTRPLNGWRDGELRAGWHEAGHKRRAHRDRPDAEQLDAAWRRQEAVASEQAPPPPNGKPARPGSRRVRAGGRQPARGHVPPA